MAAINWTTLDSSKTPVLLPDESNIMEVNDGVELTLLVPRATPAPGGIGGSDEQLKEIGRLWLTDHRLIFLSHSSTPSFETFNAQLHGILSTQFAQPYFGANHLVMELKPAPGGGLTEGTKAEVRFKDKGMFDFVNVLEKSRERAVYRRRATMMDDDLPVYTTASSSNQAVNLTAGGPPPLGDELPPGYEA